MYARGHAFIAFVLLLCALVLMHHWLIVNLLLTVGNSLKKMKSQYKVVLNPHIYKLLWAYGANDAYMHHWLVKGELFTMQP